MDGGRGFFSSAAPAAGGSTRARPVSAGTRLRQKPSAGGAEDFFASLGVDSQSRTRTGSSASTSSNRSFSSMTTRPVSASGSASSSSAGGWRPPPIGGLGSQRAAPPPMPMVGSLRVARGNSSSLVTSSTTTNVGGLSVGGVASISPEAPPAASPPAPEAPVTASSASSATTSVAAAVVTRSKPTQLFSMEDAEDLYSDDGWDCDSPSTVLSNPADEVESAAPAVVAPAARSDEFAWGDDDDAFTSPVAKPAVPPMQPPPVQTPFEAPTREYSSTTGAAFETKVETTLPPPPTTAFVPSSTFSVNSANTAIETKSFTANQMQEKHSSVEHATELTSTAPPPPAAMPPMSFSTESTQSAFETKSFPDQALPHEDPSIEASISNHRHQQDEEWNDDWGQREVATTESKTVTESTTITTAGVTTTTAITTTREDTFVTPPVELTSPGAAAGEFWGDGDEDELFDHDDHADEEWDESIKEQTASLHKLELKSGDKTQLERSAPAITGQDASFSLSAPPPVHAAYANETTNKEEESLLVPEEEAVRAFQQVHSEEIESTSKGETSDQSMEVTQAATELESSTLSSPSQSVQASEIGLYSTGASQETKHATSLDAESSPFSNAMGATSAVPDNDPNVFPEAPASLTECVPAFPADDQRIVFSSFGASPATPANAAKPIDEHELPTSDAGDLFGSGPPSGGFDNSFAQPAQQRSYGSASYQAHDQSYNQAGQGGSGERFGDHMRSSSSASADAFFGRSVTETGASSVGSDFGGERAATSSSGSTYQQAPPRDHAQPSFSRSGSNVSSYSEQHGSQFSARATPIRSSTQSHDLNTSYGSIESTGFSRHASNSSMSRYGNDASFQSQEQHVESTPVVDANAYFGQTQAATTNDTASSFFGGTTSQDSSEVQTSQPQYPNDSSNTGVQTTSQFPSPPQKQQETEREEQQQYSQSEFTHYEYSGEHFGASTAAAPVQGVRASLQTPVEHTNSSSQLYTAPSGSFQQRGSSSFGELPPVPSGVNATGRAVDSHEVSSSFAGENDPNRPQEFDRFAGSGSQGFGGQTSSDFFSGSQMQPAQASAVAASQFGTSGYGQDTQEQQQHQVHESATASLQFAETHSSYQHTSSASYREGGAHATGANSGSYFDSGVPGTGTASPASYSNQQQLQQHHPYQQRQSQQHNPTGYGYHAGSATSQLPGTGYNVATQHGPGTVTGHGHNLVSTQQTTHPAAVPAVMTSNKYKDPCVAPPSCLASFGFGGNVVTMFPKRKLRLNIAGSSYRNSPRGAPVPSEFENSNGELRKGPVNVYRMDQLHPKDKEFEQMDIFPGPLTEDVSDEAILEYLDERLKRSETSMTADEAENEDELLLLGVLRVLVKCNGKLRSEPGALNPSDPNSPEAQLIMLLSESSKWRSGNQSPTFPAPRKIQATMHPDLVLKRANDLRELLLVGDRKGAVSAAMSAHMWPEAMLIASFTDKEEYRRVLRTYLDEHYATGDPCRALFMSFADQQENSVQEPKRLLQTNAQQSTDSLILSSWVSHAQVLLANRTADTSKILTELGDRLWNELDAVAAAHVCYLLAGAQVEAPMPSSKMALLGGDHRTPKEARFYVSPAAVQRTEVYEWAQKHSKGAAANLMIPFQGYKLIYAMLLADHGKLEAAFKYVTSMLTVIKAVTATMKPGSSMYLEGMKNQLTVLDDRLRQHLGQDRVASVTASTSRGGGRKQSGKWGLGSALSMMGKIVNRVVEGNDSGGAAPAASSATTPGGLYASEATPPAASYPSSPAVTAPTSSPAPSFPQQHVHQTPPTSSRGPSPVLAGSYGHATPPMSQGSARLVEWI
ncbi:Protein transport protein SEC16A-like protein [Phytophthora ramorum]|uniref:Protein transport protein SEC16A-like protein n=1 Tax=Phytophthora ramorum TaxID=164328 RepID=UPI0030AA4B3B|nr:Protein transport protein SEC16A-like protein [Phytophthora ramorum]